MHDVSTTDKRFRLTSPPLPRAASLKSAKVRDLHKAYTRNTLTSLREILYPPSNLPGINRASRRPRRGSATFSSPGSPSAQQAVKTATRHDGGGGNAHPLAAEMRKPENYVTVVHPVVPSRLFHPLTLPLSLFLSSTGRVDRSPPE